MTSLVEVLGIVAASLKDRADELNRLDGEAGDGDLGVTVTTAGEAVNRLLPTLEGKGALRRAQRLRSRHCERSPINFGDLARNRAHGSRESGQSEFLVRGCGAGGAARCITGIDRQTRQGRAGLEDDVGRFGAGGTGRDDQRAGGWLAFGGPRCRCSGCGPRRASDPEHGPSDRSCGLARREVSWARGRWAPAWWRLSCLRPRTRTGVSPGSGARLRSIRTPAPPGQIHGSHLANK